ncbi:MAG: IS630 family transposase [Candidatus Levyibacteriota bacterium]
MVQITLTPEEKQVLRDYFKTTPLVLIRLKAQAILLRSKAMRIADIADVLGRTSRTVERWIQDFKESRLGSLFSGHAANENAAKLTRKQKEEIKKVLSQSPSLYGLPKEFWDVPQLKEYVYARFGQVYETDRSYHFLLEFGNLSFKVPDKFNIRRNEQKIAVRMEQIYEEILCFMEDPVFCSDETRMQLEAITRKAWIKKGEKTVLKVERTDDYQNYLGFLNQKTYKLHVLEIAWGRLTEIIRATGEFIKLYPNKKICIIWDNATCHKGTLMREALAKRGLLERVHLVNLPPYAPDHNPIEHVWNTIKDKLANNQNKRFEETKQKFMQLTNNQFFPYQI